MPKPTKPRHSTARPAKRSAPRSGMRGPTLRDIAERVGVSQATVSAILNNAPNAGAFAEKTRAEVRKAADALGYRINPLAQALRRKRSGVIGCVLYNQHDIYYARAIEVAEQYAKERGFSVAVASMGYDFGHFEACLLQMAAWRVEGLLFMLGGRALPSKLSAMLRKLEVPYLIGDSEDGEAPSSVSQFSHQSGRVAAEHLYGLGHRRYCALGVNRSNLHSSERLRGAEEFLRERDLSIPEALCIDVPKGVHGPNAGHVCAGLALDSGLGFTAVLCMNDLIAMGAMTRFREAGIDIPSNCSVVGFDDLSLDADGLEENRLGRFLSPPLTTVRLPMQEICKEAVRRLLSKVEDSASEASYRVEHQPRLIMRASTAAPRAMD